MLILLSYNGQIAGKLVPDKIKFKQLLELAQMISTITGSVFKPIKQAPLLRNWIKENPFFVANYFMSLFNWCEQNIKMKPETKEKLITIFNSFKDFGKENKKPTTAILRYVKGYECKYPTNTELPIDIVTEIYTDYVKNFKRWE